MPAALPVRLEVFDISGRLVTCLVRGEVLAEGRHQVTWLGHDTGGQAVASGLYFYRLEAGDFTQTRRMTLIK